jgi:hypothetical protein
MITEESSVIYAVTATVPAGVVEAYLAWLLGGHVAAVLAGGAEQAWVTRLEGDTPRIESRYRFAHRAALDHYLTHTAPGLRAEGIARFVEPYGVVFTREIGVLAWASP